MRRNKAEFSSVDPSLQRFSLCLTTHADAVRLVFFRVGCTLTLFWDILLLPETLSEAVKILKLDYLVRAINQHKMDQAIIFCRTKLDCDNAEQYLTALGNGGMVNEYSCVCLHSDRSPQERRANLAAFKVNWALAERCSQLEPSGWPNGAPNSSQAGGQTVLPTRAKWVAERCSQLEPSGWPNGAPNSSQVFNLVQVGYRLATHLAWVGSSWPEFDQAKIFVQIDPGFPPRPTQANSCQVVLLLLADCAVNGRSQTIKIKWFSCELAELARLCSTVWPGLNPFTPKFKSTFSQPFKRNDV